MKISNWDKWQSFRKDRGTPPWIKIYRNLLSNEEWVCLSDSEKGQLVSLWILAADKGGEIPNNPKMVQRMAMLDSSPNLNKFIELGFIECDGNQVTTTCQPVDNHELDLPPQVDAPEESRVETEESRGDKSKELSQPKAETVTQQMLDDVFNYWRLTTNKAGNTILNDKRKKAVKARMKEGYTVDDIKQAILGCTMTPHNMGDNPNRKIYDDLELICRDGSQLERFIGNSKHSPAAEFSRATQRTINNIIDVELD